MMIPMVYIKKALTTLFINKLTAGMINSETLNLGMLYEFSTTLPSLEYLIYLWISLALPKLWKLSKFMLKYL